MDIKYYLSNHAGLLLFIGFALVIIAAIIITVFFEQSVALRNNVLFNNMLAIMVAVGFIYIVFNFMGQKITIFQYSIDFGLILFLCMGIFIIFIIGD